MDLKGLFARKNPEARPSNIATQQEKSTTDYTASSAMQADRSEVNAPSQIVQRDVDVTDESSEKRPITKQAILLGGIASIGGFMFGYESAQISGMEYVVSLMLWY